MQNVSDATSSSLEAIGRQYQTVTSNLSNASMPGYKRRRTAFEQILGEQTQAGRITERTAVDFSQGALNLTGNPLDVAINGKGFFVVETARGNLYTRLGAFRLNGSRTLTDSAGNTVAGEDGPVIVPPQVGLHEVVVAPDGTVSAGANRVGKLKVVEFADPSVLAPAGPCYFRAPGGLAPAAPAKVNVQQGCQEASNVNLAEEMVALILASRLYEANLKTVASQDERMKNILQVAMG